MKLYSEEYRRQLIEMHAKTGWGNGGHKRVEAVNRLAVDHQATSILDYGCGKGALKTTLVEKYNWPASAIHEYDPGIPGKHVRPAPADVVACTDVLEHIEPDCLTAVIENLFNVTKKVAYILIVKQLAGKTLPDGRNTHLIVEPTMWWMGRLCDVPWRRVDIISDDEKTLIVEAWR